MGQMSERLHYNHETNRGIYKTRSRHKALKKEWNTTPYEKLLIAQNKYIYICLILCFYLRYPIIFALDFFLLHIPQQVLRYTTKDKQRKNTFQYTIQIISNIEFISCYVGFQKKDIFLIEFLQIIASNTLSNLATSNYIFLDISP